jgi:hypothetical protein
MLGSRIIAIDDVSLKPPAGNSSIFALKRPVKY